jgi:hypothetical protein
MRISRRQFACGIAGVAALGSATARPPVVIDRRLVDQRIFERRIYAHGSVLPPPEVLQRHGICPASVKRQQDGTAYWIPFDSTEARVKAWDRFNADEDWCALRDPGTVTLQEVQVYPAGKIFEISL